MFYDISQCFRSVSWCFTMFNNVLRCLVSHATIGIAASVTARPRRSPQGSRQLRRTAGIGDNSAEIGVNSAGTGDDAAGIVNGDWSNSVPGRQFPNRVSVVCRKPHLYIALCSLVFLVQSYSPSSQTVEVIHCIPAIYHCLLLSDQSSALPWIFLCSLLCYCV